MKRIAVTWTETATYESLIDVPDDYPESVEAYEDARDRDDPVLHLDPAPKASGEDEWWDRVEAQQPTWATDALMSVEDRTLTNIEVVRGAAGQVDKTTAGGTRDRRT